MHLFFAIFLLKSFAARQENVTRNALSFSFQAPPFCAPSTLFLVFSTASSLHSLRGHQLFLSLGSLHKRSSLAGAFPKKGFSVAFRLCHFLCHSLSCEVTRHSLPLSSFFFFFLFYHPSSLSICLFFFPSFFCKMCCAVPCK